MVKRTWESFTNKSRELRMLALGINNGTAADVNGDVKKDDDEEGHKKDKLSPSTSRSSNDRSNHSLVSGTRRSRNGGVIYTPEDEDDDDNDYVGRVKLEHLERSGRITRRSTRSSGTSGSGSQRVAQDAEMNGESSSHYGGSGRSSRTRRHEDSNKSDNNENDESRTTRSAFRKQRSSRNDDDGDIKMTDAERNHDDIASAKMTATGVSGSDHEDNGPVDEGSSSNSSADEDYMEEVPHSAGHLEHSHDSNDDLFVAVQLRRSRRHRKQRFDTYEESWMLGGGPEARGYRRSRRLVKDSKITDYATSDCGGNGTSLADGGGTSVNESEEDMYSRVKKRRTSFGGRTNRTSDLQNAIRNRARSISLPRSQPEKEEPVCRRLRDRSKLTLSAESARPLRMTRQNKVEMLLRNHLRRTKRKRRDSSSSSSSSSSSDSSATDKSPSKKRSRSRKRALAGPGFNLGQNNRNMSKKEMMMLMEVQPIAVDPNISFESVGGLNQFIGKLKEIVLFPLMYGEFYNMRGMRPPRGILLHGPPGTGKTLLARALANECSNINGKKVSFFLRKGADLLNKWIGESERQLRMLFQQAALHQPSIIFFDEIDGLAPVRSAKSDQIHNSIVSTLLAELDGLQDRGQVIVIGSTNRLDFIDPALRRPGRFDCELPIFLPTRDGRRDILKVHVSKWKDLPSDELIDELADRSIGFSGADLKLLCWNSSMNSLRRTYPQIYGSNLKYLLDYESITMHRDDWELALKTVSPSTSRSLFSKYSPTQPLPLYVKPLLEKSLGVALEVINQVFPFKSLSLVTEDSLKRIVLHTYPEGGLDTYIVPALLHTMETLPVHVLSHEALHMDGIPVDFSVTQICAEVLKQSGPSVLYIPALDRLISALSENAKEIIIRMIQQSVKKPVLILATIQESTYNLIRHDEEELLNIFKGCFLQLDAPLRREIKKFFEPVFEQALKVKVKHDEAEVFKQLELAPPESPEKKKPDVEETKMIEKRETAVFRELRIFLREVLSKIVRNKKFEEFTKPVDLEEVPDYLQVIHNPMDLETMMCKVNMGQYQSGSQFMDDVKLISSNCLNYNPHKTDSDKRLRLRAFELLDFATKLLEEMDSDFEDQCNEIIKARIERNAPIVEVPLIIEPDLEPTPVAPMHPQPSTSAGSAASAAVGVLENKSLKIKSPTDLATPNGVILTSTPTTSSVRRPRKRTSNWSKGCVKKTVRKPRVILSSEQSQSSLTQSSQDSQQNEANQSDEEVEEDRKSMADPPTTKLSPSPVLMRKESAEEANDESASVESLVCNSGSGTSPTADRVEDSPMEDIIEEEVKGTVKCDGDYYKTCENETECKVRFSELLDETVKVCESYTVIKLLDVRFHLLRLVEKHQYSSNKEELAQDISKLLNTAEEKECNHILLKDKLT